MCSLGHWAMSFLILGGAAGPAVAQVSTLGETHPYQEQLLCDRAPGNYMVGVLYNVSGGQKVKIGEFSSFGHVGACEMALRASRAGRVCVPRNWQIEAIEISSGNSVRQFGSNLNACMDFTKGWDLDTRPGFTEFIDAKELNPFIANMPQVDNQTINEVLHSTETMWYDEASMVFTYQDSSGSPQGLRANRVGYDVGSTNSNSDIRALTEYFQHGKFRFPFSIASGADYEDDIYVLNFWSPPMVNGERLPVTWWKNSSHWHWVFPIDTVIGEVLLMRAPDDREWYVFEVRSRTRRRDGWTTDVFRPFADAADMAEGIRDARPNWNTTDLKNLVDHLERNDTLVPATLSSEAYADAFTPIYGAYDYLPATSDAQLIKTFLRERTFVSTMGKSWKRDGSKATYAASTRAGFHIVPPNYIGGMLETTEEACSACHNQTGRPMGQLDGRVVAYGEIWGEDQIFTWHPFDITVDAFSVSDGNRRVNARLVQAGLLKQRRPIANDPYYTELAKPYPARY